MRRVSVEIIETFLAGRFIGVVRNFRRPLANFDWNRINRRIMSERWIFIRRDFSPSSCFRSTKSGYRIRSRGLLFHMAWGEATAIIVTLRSGFYFAGCGVRDFYFGSPRFTRRVDREIFISFGYFMLIRRTFTPFISINVMCIASTFFATASQKYFLPVHRSDRASLLLYEYTVFLIL